MGRADKAPVEKSTAERRRSETRKASASPGNKTSTPSPRPASAASTSAPRRKPSSHQDWSYTHVPANSEQLKANGRVQGRNLISWTRPRMAEKALMSLVYELSIRGITIPFDEATHRLSPGSSGSSLEQYLVRMRNTLIAEGHAVPPPFNKVVDPGIRGYIREFPHDPKKLTQARALKYSEPWQHPKSNLVDAVSLVHNQTARRASQNESGESSSSAAPPDTGSDDSHDDSQESVTEPGNALGIDNERRADFFADLCRIVSQYQSQSQATQPQPQAAQSADTESREPTPSGDSPQH
ncbi:hypothetical protein F5Y04DRAFT_283879 [Hypomontagnella monticulosa]|nr:hypothetical protein F5Y04DRAFT_283879 [Hypomontagnella monticulosa]